MRVSVLLIALLMAGCGGEKVEGPPPAAPAGISVTSPAFEQGGAIPARFTCEGDDISPPLAWSGVPDGARALALLVEDPDAPGGTFVHWTAYGMAAAATGSPEGGLPEGAREGENSFGDARYGGPCPPEDDEPHRYRFLLYALAEPVELEAGAPPGEVRAAIAAARPLASGRLEGRFGR